MKNKIGIRRAAAAGLMVCTMLLSACGSTGDPTPGPGTSNPENQGDQPVLSFVAADKSNWDKEISIGDYTYILAVDFQPDGTIDLTATCTGAAQAQQQQQGGPGIPGVNGNQGESEPASAPAEMTDAEKAAQSFTKSGSWEYETGYGYTLTIDGYTTKTNYDKPSARQIFYAEISNGDTSSGLVQFQGKDTAFRNEIAGDYQDFEVRDAVYIFQAVDTGTNNNPNSTKLYLEKDGSANSLTYQGSSPTYRRGTWQENTDRSLTVALGGSDYTVDYCDLAGKEGYRVTYNSSTMYASLSGAQISYTDEDFNGATLLTLQCAEQDYAIALTEKGFAVVYKNGASDSTGRYTQSGDSYTIVLNGESFVSEDGSITVEFPNNSRGGPFGGGGPGGPFGGGDPSVRTFALDGTVPADGAPDEGGAPEDGMPPAGND